ncbi:MAG: ubiquinol-cytochrome c reductase iron-sulfur subunit [Halothiobacillaceae bacterium]|nr:ubiquinol-cytochrome c reductase iron-sulfur subunit [Halothiobacillaceae bacterium]
MPDNGVNTSRRRFLTGAATVIGGVGAGFVAVPFLSSFQPSARAQAAGAPVEVDVSKLAPGQMVTVEWRGKPVYVVHRTPAMLESLPGQDGHLRDPQSKESIQPEDARNEARAVKPEYLIVVGICTHLGCAPTYRPDVAPADLGAEWKGGFFCPCHGSRFDMAGRVYKSVPAPTNLEVPPYTYLSDTVVLIGAEEGAAS